MAPMPEDRTEHQGASQTSRWAQIAARLIMAGIFIYASIDKIAHPAAFAKDVYNYQILPDALINLTALVLPWLELLLGLCLLAGIWLPGAVLAVNGLLIVFLAALVFNLARGARRQLRLFQHRQRRAGGVHRLVPAEGCGVFRRGSFLVLRDVFQTRLAAAEMGIGPETRDTTAIMLKPVLIEFSPEEVQRLLSIALDDDGDAALAFIRKDLVKRVEKALQRR